MRTFVFTLLALVIAIGIQCGLGALPDSSAMGGYVFASNFVLPLLATAGLAYAMRISNLLYVLFVAILAPAVSGFLIFVVEVHVLHKPVYFW